MKIRKKKTKINETRNWIGTGKIKYSHLIHTLIMVDLSEVQWVYIRCLPIPRLIIYHGLVTNPLILSTFNYSSQVN